MLEGKKINELPSISTVSDETVVPAVYVNNGTVNSEASKVTLNQIKAHINEDNYTKEQTDTLLNTKQDKLNAGKGIDLESDEIFIDNTVYTSENLVGGDQIKIETEYTGEGIDANTLYCWHFNKEGDTATLNDYKDVVNGIALGADGTNFYPLSDNSKFGSSSLRFSNYTYDIGTATMNLPSFSTTDFTYDFWIYLDASSRFSLRLNSTFYLLEYLRAYGRTYLDVFGNSTQEASGTMHYYYAAEIDANTIKNDWHHIAVTWNHLTNTVTVFLDGTKFSDKVLGSGPYETDCINATYSVNNIVTYMDTGTYVNPFTTNTCIDELRISNTIRYVGNFIPPIKQYGTAIATGRKAINFDPAHIYGYSTTDDKVLKTENGILKWDEDKTGTVYTAGTGIEIESDEISIDDTVLTKTKLVAGSNVTIAEDSDENLVISSTGGGGNNGADKDLSNLTDAGKIVAGNMSMPSDTYDELSLISNTFYTAASDGYISVTGIASESYIGLYIMPSTATSEEDSSLISVKIAQSGLANKIFAPISKGQKFFVYGGNYKASGYSAKFIYAIGAESEYTPAE